jgi:uncharacterized membrane protein
MSITRIVAWVYAGMALYGMINMDMIMLFVGLIFWLIFMNKADLEGLTERLNKLEGSNEVNGR